MHEEEHSGGAIYGISTHGTRLAIFQMKGLNVSQRGSLGEIWSKKSSNTICKVSLLLC